MNLDYNNDIIEIDTMELMKLWIKKAWIIIGVGVLCATVAWIWCKASTKQIYRSNGKLLVINQREELTSDGQITTNANLTDDYIEVIKSRTVVNKVIETLGLTDSYEQFVGKITVSRIDETRILMISVSDMDATRVKAIVDELLKVSSKYMESFLEVYSVKILDEASEPIGYASLNMKKYIILAFGAGVAIVLLCLTLYYILNDTIENARQIKQKLYCETLGIVSGKGEELENIETIRTNIKALADKLRTLAITNCSEKDGTYDLAYKVASSFAKNENKVLFIDANLRGEKQENEKMGLCNILEKEKDLHEFVVNTDVNNLFLLSAGKYCDRPSELLDSKQFDDFLEQAKCEYDLVIFSTTPMGKYIDTVVVAKRCDATIMVVESKQTSYKKIQNALMQLLLVKANVLGCIIVAKKV